MKKILILIGIASTISLAKGSAMPAGSVSCGDGRYRFDPYIPVVVPQLPAYFISPENFQLSVSANADEPTTATHYVQKTAAASQQLSLPEFCEEWRKNTGSNVDALPAMLHRIMPDALFTSFEGSIKLVTLPKTPIQPSHPLYQTLVNGVPPITNLVENTNDFSILAFTAEIARNPQIISNYEKHILPQLKNFVKRRLQDEMTKDKQIQIYDVLSNFFSCTGNLNEAIYMLMGKFNIYSIRHQNVAGFNELEPSIELMSRAEKLKKGNNQRMFGTVLLMMVRAVYYMTREERKIYKPRLDQYFELCRSYIVLNLLQDDHIRRLKALDYFDQL
jgi:hypothetical protein